MQSVSLPTSDSGHVDYGNAISHKATGLALEIKGSLGNIKPRLTQQACLPNPTRETSSPEKGYLSGLSCTRTTEILDIHWRGDEEALSNNLEPHRLALLRVLIGKHEKALEVLYRDYLLLYYTVAVTEKEGVSQHGRSNWRLVWFNGCVPCLTARETLERGDFDKEWKIRVHTVKQHDHTSYKVHLNLADLKRRVLSANRNHARSKIRLWRKKITVESLTTRTVKSSKIINP